MQQKSDFISLSAIAVNKINPASYTQKYRAYCWNYIFKRFVDTKVFLLPCCCLLFIASVVTGVFAWWYKEFVYN